MLLFYEQFYLVSHLPKYIKMKISVKIKYFHPDRVMLSHSHYTVKEEH